MRTTIALVCLPMLFSACQPSIKVDGRPVLELNDPRAQLDPALAEPCRDPIDLMGMQGLNAGPVERFWSIDRKSLVECKTKHQAVVDSRQGLVNALRGDK